MQEVTIESGCTYGEIADVLICLKKAEDFVRRTFKHKNHSFHGNYITGRKVMVNLEDYAQRFSEKLKTVRQKKQVSRKQLADALNMTEVGFGKYERGRIPTIDKVFVIAETLECSITDLLGDTYDGRREKEFNQRFERAKQILANSACQFEETDEGKIIISLATRTQSYVSDKGGEVSRIGWNGKEQYIELATCISYKNIKGDIVNVNHAAIGNEAIAFVGTSGIQIGWLASQADMLAEDWRVIEK